MYILIIARGYPSEKYRTNGIFEFDQAKALKELGHKVVYMAVDLRSIRRFRKLGYESLVLQNIPIEAINLPLGNIYRNIVYRLGISYTDRLYQKIVKKYGIPDIIHSHFTLSSYIASMALNHYDIPMVYTEHSSLMNKPILSKNLIDMTQSIIKNVDKVIVVGQALAGHMTHHFDIKPDVIPNIVDTDVFKYQAFKPSKPYTFVSAGNLLEVKNMSFLIDAYNEAFKNNPNVLLLIYGQGPLAQSLQAQINQLGLQNQVILKGFKSRLDLADTLQKSDCFVLASKSETFGVVYIEALAVGVPVIATKCGGPEDFINQDNGLLIDLDDKNQLIEALHKMVKLSHQYDRLGISVWANQHYSPSAVASQLTHLYKSLIKEHQ